MQTHHYDRDTALVVVDIQNDFADPQGSLAVPGGESVVKAAAAEVEAAVEADALVVYTTDWHPEHTPHFAEHGGPWPAHCVAGTWGAEFHPGLPLKGPIVRKGEGQDDGYSGMNVRGADGTVRPTALPGILEERGIKRVVVAGLATDYCVAATAIDLRAAGYETLVLGDAVAAVDVAPGDGEEAIARMAVSGVRVVPGAGAR
jgi:nicotinamidase/pyrazinamidase